MSIPYHTSIIARFQKFVHLCQHGVSCHDCCWLYLGSCNKKGYGGFHAGVNNVGKQIRLSAHVFAWQVAHDKLVPDENIICHNCPTGDNPSCVQPAHLWLGTYSANNLDSVSKGRFGYRGNSGEKNGTVKLKECDIPRIVMLYQEGASLKEIGIIFEVSKQVIHAILTGKTWRHITQTLVPVDTSLRKTGKLQATDIPIIFALAQEGINQAAIGQRFGVDNSVICRILLRQTWKHASFISSSAG